MNTTPLEAGWVGRLVIELGNLADLPLRVYVNEGIGQVLFFESEKTALLLTKSAAGNISDRRD